MSSESRRKKHKTDLRNLILEKSAGLISSGGYESLTIRKLAASIEYSPRTVYLYYKSKQEILDCLIEKVFSETVETMNRNSEHGSPNQDFFRKMIKRHLQNAAGNPNLYRAVISGINSIRHQPGSSEKEFMNRLSDIFSSSVRKNIRGNADEASQIFLSSLHCAGLRLAAISGGAENKETEAYISLCIEMILGGIL